MARLLELGLPAGGLAVGVLALALWFSALPLGWLDLLVALLFLTGLGLGLAGAWRGGDSRARRVGVLALGWNAFGLLAIAIVYLAG